MAERYIVKFNRHWRRYNAGEMAGFNKVTADMLVDNGVATLVNVVDTHKTEQVLTGDKREVEDAVEVQTEAGTEVEIEEGDDDVHEDNDDEDDGDSDEDDDEESSEDDDDDEEEDDDDEVEHPVEGARAVKEGRRYNVYDGDTVIAEGLSKKEVKELGYEV